VAVVGLGCVTLVVWLVYRRQLRAARFDPAMLHRHFAVHHSLIVKTVGVVVVMLAAFLAGVPVALVAVGGAAYTLLTRRVKPAKVYSDVNWQLLVLFTGLFVLIGGMEASGLIHELFRWAEVANLHRPIVLTAVAAALSNLVSNVPAVLLFKSVIPGFGEPARGWLLLAMASTLAGNLTILGSVANLIVVEAARAARVEISFVEYCRVGVPLTLLTLGIGWLILSLIPL
jgi:Na+/H+ antiporter NhaD/arsenite permease-like protein